ASSSSSVTVSDVAVGGLWRPIPHRYRPIQDSLMDEQTFDRLAADVLRNLDVALMDLDGADVDLGGDVLSIEFADGATYIVNSPRHGRQIGHTAGGSAAH